MAQPTLTILTVTPQQAAWDATVNTNFQALREWLEDGPLPVYDNATRPTASTWQSALMLWLNGGETKLSVSNGSTWQTYAREGTFVAALGLTVSNPPTQTEVQQINDKLDELIAALKVGHALPVS